MCVFVWCMFVGAYKPQSMCEVRGPACRSCSLLPHPRGSWDPRMERRLWGWSKVLSLLSYGYLSFGTSSLSESRPWHFGYTSCHISEVCLALTLPNPGSSAEAPVQGQAHLLMWVLWIWVPIFMLLWQAPYPLSLVPVYHFKQTQSTVLWEIKH